MKISWLEDNTLAAGPIPISEVDIRSLHDQGIRAIVSLTEHPITVIREITDQLFEALDITYRHAPIDDGCPPDIATMQQVTQFINSMATQSRATYVHCHAGVGRTGTVLHGFYIVNGSTLEEAQTRVKSRRPTSGFIMLTEAQRNFLVSLSEINL